jgi:hypothetical protein
MLTAEERKHVQEESIKRNGKSKELCKWKPSEFRMGTNKTMQQGPQLYLHTTTANCIT